MVRTDTTLVVEEVLEGKAMDVYQIMEETSIKKTTILDAIKRSGKIMRMVRGRRTVFEKVE